jgi:hypothetical protein
MWINQTEIKSSSGPRTYTISELVVNGAPTGTWGCSCPGWKSHGHCKHLDSRNLPSARGNVTQSAVTMMKNQEFDEVMHLVDEHEMTVAELQELDEWVQTGEFAGVLASSGLLVVDWLRSLPLRKK